MAEEQNTDTSDTESTLSREEEAAILRGMLETSPDEAQAILSRLVPSADPSWLREQFEAATQEEIDETTGEAVPVGVGAPKAVWPFPTSTKVDTSELEAFTRNFASALGGEALSREEVSSERFQTKEDWHRYAFAKGAIGYHAGTMSVSEPMWRALTQPARGLTHELRPDQDPSQEPLRIGLFADFGNGTYPTQAMARQFLAAQLPYLFHLGDVYYAGTTEEFENYFSAPMRPLLPNTELFMLSGNHEMYSKGVNFQAFLKEKATSYPGFQRQNGEMFRLKGAGLQIIGIDTMWTYWKSGKIRSTARLGEAERAVLREWLNEAGQDQLTILLTSDHPWDLGDKGTTPLLADMGEFVREGLIDLWFWGNVHYAALYAPWQFVESQNPGFIGSCIGHGGYPFYTQDATKLPKGVELRWCERKHRFWPFENVRPDLGLNGWCEMTLSKESGAWKVKLSYRDWVGRERAIANIVKHAGGRVQFERVFESDYDADQKLVFNEV